MCKFLGSLLVLVRYRQDLEFPAGSWGMITKKLSWETTGISDDEGRGDPHIRTGPGVKGQCSWDQKGLQRTRRGQVAEEGYWTQQGKSKHFTGYANQGCWEGPDREWHPSESKGATELCLDLRTPSFCSLEITEAISDGCWGANFENWET